MSRRVILTLMFVFVLADALAAAELRFTPEQAGQEISRYCVDTGASAGKLEKILTALPSDPMNTVVEKLNDEVHVDRKLGDGFSIDVVYMPGQMVSRCYIHFFVEDIPKTAALIGQKFGISSLWQDHQGGEQGRKVVLPNGLPAQFGYTKMSSDNRGGVTVFVYPPTVSR